MNNIITFVIPVRHPINCKNWDLLKKNLTNTIKSIANQNSDGWKAVIVANTGSVLPVLPANFEVKFVDFPPNSVLEQVEHDSEAFRDAVRFDKGRRVLAGMLHAGETGHFMVVDDDDFVSSRLTSFVAENPKCNGWYILKGFIWSDGGKLLYNYSDFSMFCGTSLIIRADLYNLPKSIEEADYNYICKMLGSHIFIRNHLVDINTPLEPLPFNGAIYRVAHSDSLSKSPGIFKLYFLKRNLLKRPFELIRRIFRLKLITASISKEFWG